MHRSQWLLWQLAVEPGMRVIDACAGAGAKSLHLLRWMQNKRKVFRWMWKRWKLQQTKLRARRDGVASSSVKWSKVSKTISDSKRDSRPRLLLDVPCSDWVFFEKSWTRKWKLRRRINRESFRKTQQEISSKPTNRWWSQVDKMV